jgi:tripartite ATP-independent transporter DctP family solute receptor
MKKIASILLTVGLMISLATCSGSGRNANGGPSAKETILLRLGHNAHQESSVHKALEFWGKSLAEKTNGALTVEIFPDAQLGSLKEMAEQVTSGSLDLNLASVNRSVDYGVEVGYIGKVPCLFRSFEQVDQFYESPSGQALFKQMEEAAKVKVVVNGMYYYPRELVSKQPIRHPVELKGIKLRCGDAAGSMAFAAFGAAPTTISINEMYTALSKGMIDAVELPIDFVMDYSVYEVTKYLTVTDHLYDTKFLYMNERRWESLSADYQKLMQEIGFEAIRRNNKEVLDGIDKVYADLKAKGLEIIQVDKKEWSDHLKKVIPIMEKEWPATKGLYEQILAMP